MSSRRRSAGFTLIELMVVMGILMLFASFLIQIMRASVTLFDEGERGQDLAARADVAGRALRDAVADLVGPGVADVNGREPATRMILQFVPLAVPTGAPAGGRRPAAGGEAEPGPQVQMLRGTVRIDATTETELLQQALRAEAEATAVSRSETGIRDRLDELVAAAPRGGRAQMLLAIRPDPADPTVFLQLRRLLVLPGATVAVDDRTAVDPMAVEVPGGADLPFAVIDAASEVLASSLLHAELACWSQFTRSWSAQPGDGGPEFVWDSARAGLLPTSEDPTRSFSLDAGPDSLTDLRDDVFPRWVRVTVVVASFRDGKTVLQRELRAADRSAEVADESRLPDPTETPFVKIGSEWVRSADRDGRQLRGLRRGQRGTIVRDHPAGTPVRAGRTVEMFVRLPHGKGDWNE